MKSIFKGLLICLLVTVTRSYGQNQSLTVKDSIHHFYDKFFEALEEHYLHTKDVDWISLKSYIKEEALKKPSFQTALESTVKLFDTIRGDHLILFTEKSSYHSTLGKEITADDFNDSLLDAYNNGKGFEAKVVNKEYGYVLIPGMLLLNATREELDEAGQGIYDAIIEVEQSADIKGWIIDLRLNIGGNSNVMLAGLYHLLGNGVTHLSLNKDKHLNILTSINEGILYKNHKVNTAVEPKLDPRPQVPVALISGIITGSAGEFVLLGFRGRENSIIIGEESYGYTTANDLHELPFGTKAAITESYGTDRSAKYTSTIIPDIEVIKATNFEDLSKDKNILEAIKFIDSKQ